MMIISIFISFILLVYNSEGYIVHFTQLQLSFVVKGIVHPKMRKFSHYTHPMLMKSQIKCQSPQVSRSPEIPQLFEKIL